MAQYAVLVTLALLYLEGMLARHDGVPAVAAGSGAAALPGENRPRFSLEQFSLTVFDQSPKYLFISVAELVLNVFLTLAFWRVRPAARPLLVAAAGHCVRQPLRS